MDEVKKYFSPKEVAEKSGYKVNTLRQIAAKFEEHNQHFSKQSSKGRIYDEYALAAILLYKSRVGELGEQDAVRFGLKIIYNISIN